MHKIIRLKVIVVIIFVITAISIVNYSLIYLSTQGPLNQTQIIVIPKKLSITQITHELYQHEVIINPKFFALIAKIYSLQFTLKSGEYQFTPKITPLQVLQILSDGKSIVRKLVIPEGFTVHEIINKINEEGRLFGEITEKIPEGFLMPSTYFFSYGDQKHHIIDQMRKNMSEKLDIVMKQLSPHSPLKTRMDVLILASIIEKETAIDAEYPMVAAVFLNRLKKGMKLQADPTTIYAITKGKFVLDRPLTKTDLAIQSPYNTYYVKNLPPGAISCPGFKALQAAVNPSNISALYFVVNNLGGHNFSDTLDAHNTNVRNYKISKELKKNQ